MPDSIEKNKSASLPQFQDVKTEQGKVQLLPTLELPKAFSFNQAEWVKTAKKIATLAGENMLALASFSIGLPFFLVTVVPFVGIGALVNMIKSKINEAEDRQNNVMYDELMPHPALRGPAMMTAFKISFCILHYAGSILLKDYQLYQAHQEKKRQEQAQMQSNVQQQTVQEALKDPKTFTLTNQFANTYCQYVNGMFAEYAVNPQDIALNHAKRAEKLDNGGTLSLEELAEKNRDDYLSLLQAFTKDLPETMELINRSLNQVPGLSAENLQKIDEEFSKAASHLIMYTNPDFMQRVNPGGFADLVKYLESHPDQDKPANFQQYLRLSNETLLSLNQLGEELDRQGKHEEAGKVFNLLLHLNPDNRFYWISYALSVHHAGNLEGAINILNNCNGYTEGVYEKELELLAEDLERQANQITNQAPKT